MGARSALNYKMKNPFCFLVFLDFENINVLEKRIRKRAVRNKDNTLTEQKILLIKSKIQEEIGFKDLFDFQIKINEKQPDNKTINKLLKYIKKAKKTENLFKKRFK